MSNPIVKQIPSNEWIIAAGNITTCAIWVLTTNASKLWKTHRKTGESKPTDLSDAVKLSQPFDKFKNPDAVDFYIYSEDGTTSIRVDEQTDVDSPIKPNQLLLNRPMSSNGLSDGDTNINPNASIGSPSDYFVEALSGERLLVARAMVHVVDSGSFDSGSYGNNISMTNGMQVFYRRSGVDLDVSNGLPIKTNVDWGRWCYDITISNFGAGNEALNARWTLTKYGHPYGIILEEGDRLGIRVRDNLSGLVEQTIILEGVHLGVPNINWTFTL